MVTITVDLGDRSYPIEICQGFGDLPAALAAAINTKQLMIVSNDVVAPIYLDEVRSALPDSQIAECVLADGEQFKDLKAVEAVITRLLESKFDRGCTLIALGGGVVGDITGFAAASYQRGVSFIQIPTRISSFLKSGDYRSKHSFLSCSVMRHIMLRLYRWFLETNHRRNHRR